MIGRWRGLHGVDERTVRNRLESVDVELARLIAVRDEANRLLRIKRREREYVLKIARQLKVKIRG